MSKELVEKWKYLLPKGDEARHELIATLLENQLNALGDVKIETCIIQATTRKLRAKWTLEESLDTGDPDTFVPYKRYKITDRESESYLIITKSTRDNTCLPFHYTWESKHYNDCTHSIGGFFSEENVMNHMKNYHGMEVGKNLEEVP